MHKVQKNIELLKLLSICKNRMLKAVISASDKELILCLCECILNCLNGNVALGDKEKLKLKRYKTELRSLIEKRSSIKKKKNILIQKGSGFLPILLPAIISAIASLLQ